MKLRVTGGYGGELPGCRATSFVIDECLALDAGNLTAGLTLDEQSRLRHILISHSHADHCISLTYFSENVFARIPGPVEVLGTEQVLQALHTHLLNDVLWPDMSCAGLGVLKLTRVEPLVPHACARWTITPVPVPHTVPCTGFHIDDGRIGLLYMADMGPNDEVWEFARSVQRLDAVLIECSFPTRLQEVARVSRHLTARDLGSELTKLRRPCDLYIHHLKPAYHDEIVAELEPLRRLYPLQIIQQDSIYRIGGE